MSLNCPEPTAGHGEHVSLQNAGSPSMQAFTRHVDGMLRDMGQWWPWSVTSWLALECRISVGLDDPESFPDYVIL